MSNVRETTLFDLKNWNGERERWRRKGLNLIGSIEFHKFRSFYNIRSRLVNVKCVGCVIWFHVKVHVARPIDNLHVEFGPMSFHVFGNRQANEQLPCGNTVPLCLVRVGAVWFRGWKPSLSNGSEQALIIGGSEEAPLWNFVDNKIGPGYVMLKASVMFFFWFFFWN